MEITIVTYKGDKEFERVYKAEVPDDITCLGFLQELKKLAVQIGFSADLVNNDWERVDDV